MGKGTCTPIIPQPSCHAAHYHVVLTSPPKKKHPNGPKGDLQADISRRMDNGLRVQYKPRGIESWPSTRVRQLPSSNGVRDNWGRTHTRLGLKPLSRGAPRRIRGQKRSRRWNPLGGRHRALGSYRMKPRSTRLLFGIFGERLRGR
jgi:hypothetical protein